MHTFARFFSLLAVVGAPLSCQGANEATPGNADDAGAGVAGDEGTTSDAPAATTAAGVAPGDDPVEPDPADGADWVVTPGFDPTLLDDIPDHGWVDLALPWRGGNQVPAIFDVTHQVFFKYGGCGDHSPKINVAGSPRPNETYGNSCWTWDMKTGNVQMRRAMDVSFPKDRPSNGCSRSYAYDSKRHLIWMYGGISNGGGGGAAFDMWTYDAGTDVFTQMHATNGPAGGDGNGGDNFVYDSHRDIFIMPKMGGSALWNHVAIYDPKTNAWEMRSVSNGPTFAKKAIHYESMVFDPVSKTLLYPRRAATGKTATSLTPGMDPNRWMPTEAGTYVEFMLETWSYDPDTNEWTNLRSAAPPAPLYRNLFGLVYDSKNDAILLIGGTSDTWDKAQVNFNDVWRYDRAQNAWTLVEPAGGVKPSDKIGQGEARHCAYDPVHNVVLYVRNQGTLWAFRYKN